MAVNDVDAGEWAYEMYEIIFVKFWVIILCVTVRSSYIKTEKNFINHLKPKKT